jgi:hypothetical protein
MSKRTMGAYERDRKMRDAASDKNASTTRRKAVNQKTREDKSGSRYDLKNVLQRPDME